MAALRRLPDLAQAVGVVCADRGIAGVGWRRGRRGVIIGVTGTSSKGSKLCVRSTGASVRVIAAKR